jgi:hypothetical protein
MSEVDSLKKKLEHYERLLGIGQSDPALKGYKTYVRIINQQIEFLENFNIKSNIDGKKTETVMYERAESMWNGLPKMISSLNALKLELKIEYNEDVDKPRAMPSSPQSIGL